METVYQTTLKEMEMLMEMAFPIISIWTLTTMAYQILKKWGQIQILRATPTTMVRLTIWISIAIMMVFLTA